MARIEAIARVLTGALFLTLMAPHQTAAGQAAQPQRTEAIEPLSVYVDIEGRAAEEIYIAWRAVHRKFERRRELREFDVTYARTSDGTVIVSFGRAWFEGNLLYVDCYNTNIKDRRVVFVGRCNPH